MNRIPLKKMKKGNFIIIKQKIGEEISENSKNGAQHCSNSSRLLEAGILTLTFAASWFVCYCKRQHISVWTL